MRLQRRWRPDIRLPLDRLNRTADNLLWGGVGLLLSAPLFFTGAVDPLPERMVTVAAFFLGLILLWRNLAAAGAGRVQPEDPRMAGLTVKILLVTAGLIVMYGLALSVEVPHVVGKLLSPAAARLYRQAREAVAAGDPHGSFPLSLAPGATVQAVAKLGGITAFFFVCLLGFLDWRKTEKMVLFFMVVTLVVSGLVVYQFLARKEALLFQGAAAGGMATLGLFINRNHSANYLAMAAVLGLGYVRALPYISGGHGRERAFGGPFPSRHLVAGGATLSACLAVMLSMSAGGMLSLASGLAGYGLLMKAREKANQSLKIMGSALAVVVGAIFLMTYRPQQTFFRPDAQAMKISVRWGLSRDTLRMMAGQPLVGTGPGTFSRVYPSFQTVNRANHYTYAHNDYLQLLSEWGVLGAGLFVFGAVGYLRLFAGRWRRRRHPAVLHLSAGAFGAVMVMMVHSLVDFSLHIPANALAFAFLAALALKVTALRLAPPVEEMTDEMGG